MPSRYRLVVHFAFRIYQFLLLGPRYIATSTVK